MIMKILKLRRRQSGFTLVEVLIALFIFSVGILGLGAMQLNSIRGNSQARRISEATNVAADQIEKFFALDYDDPDLNDDDGNGSAGLSDITSPDGSTSSVDGNYQIFWNVAVNYPLADAKTIRVLVRQNNQTKTVSLETVKLMN